MSLFKVPRPASWQACLACGEEFLESQPVTRCGCGGLLEVRHGGIGVSPADLQAVFRTRRQHVERGHRSGVWRYQELVLPSVSAETIVSHPEGNTPLLERVSVTSWTGLESLLMKHEGHNPTGSFKDRGMTVGVTQARRANARAVACASTGNTAASMAAYAAQANLPAFVLIPQGGVSVGKLAQIIAYGATVLEVAGDFDDCLRVLEAVAPSLDIYLLNSINPFRVEGQKTVVFDLLDQLEWDPPDWIVFPAGNLGNTAAFGKALEEAYTWGLIPRLPRLAAIQAAGAAPFAAGFREGFSRRHRVKAETIATAIRIGNPASWDRARVAIERTNGVVTTVTDQQILAAKHVVDHSGVGCEPASAASIAGARRLREEGVITPHDRVVAVLTGHILKDPDSILNDADGTKLATVEPTAEAVTRAIMTS